MPKEISREKFQSMWQKKFPGKIPKGFAHGYSSLAKENIVIYFLSEDWYPSQESGIIWNDKFLNINWGIRKPILSKKDKLLKPFSKL